MPQADIDWVATGQMAGTLLISGLTYAIGRYQNWVADLKKSGAQTALIQSRRDEADVLERNQLLEHYRQLLSLNQGHTEQLRQEVLGLRREMQEMEKRHQSDLIELHKEHESCRVENARLKSELAHVRQQVEQLKENLENRTVE